jgi:hypothetical protein
LTLAPLLVFVSALAFTAAPALAAAPEAPHTEAPSPLAATSATLKGKLNPGVATEKVTYHFAYTADSAGPGTATCTESGVTAPAAEPFPEAAGKNKEVTAAVTGLEGSTEYTVCLIAANPVEPTESTEGNSLTFTTSASKPVVFSQVASAETQFTATVEAQVNPENQPTELCVFEYGPTTAYGKSAPCEPAIVEGTSVQSESVNLTKLTAGAEVHYRFVVKNATGETKGPDGHFTTLPLEKPSASAESASTVSPFEETLNAEVNPNSQETTVYFQYSESSAVLGSGSLKEGVTQVPGEPGNSIGSGFGNVPATTPTGDVLTQNTTYYYQAVAVNPTGTTYGTVESFTTSTAEKPIVESESVSNETLTGAELEATVDPNFQETKCEFQYGTDSSLATSTTVPCEPEHLGTGGPGAGATLALSGLTAGETYYYRVVAENATPPAAEGAIQSFTTLIESPSQIETGIAQSVTATSATIGGQLNPGGEARYYIAYGPGPCGTCEKSAEVVVRGETLQSITPIALSGLEPNTTYHYSLEVKNGASEPLNGGEGVFTTAKTSTQIEEEAAISRKPGEELAATIAAQSELAAERASQQAASAASAAAENKKYEELAAETTALLTPKLAPVAAPPKVTTPKLLRCKKGYTKKHDRCVKSKKKKQAKRGRK